MMIPEHIRALLVHGKIYSHDQDGAAFIFPGMVELEKIWAKAGARHHRRAYRRTPGQSPVGMVEVDSTSGSSRPGLHLEP